jgi:predicted permease
MLPLVIHFGVEVMEGISQRGTLIKNLTLIVRMVYLYGYEGCKNNSRDKNKG